MKKFGIVYEKIRESIQTTATEWRNEQKRNYASGERSRDLSGRFFRRAAPFFPRFRRPVQTVGGMSEETGGRRETRGERKRGSNYRRYGN